MKKLLSAVLVSLVLISITACHKHGFDEDGVCVKCGYEDYQYDMELSFDGTYYRLAGVLKTLSGEVTLPETYKGLPVKEVDIWGFSPNSDETGEISVSGVTKVVIPDSYEKIGANAFDKMPSLKTVIIGNGVKEIYPSAFESCKNLETVIFGDSVEGIYAEAFQHCEKLKDVVLPASLKEITYRAFAYCESITSIVIPKGVTKIIEDAFYSNSSLTNVYCEAEAQPSTWEAKWLGNYRSYSVNKNVTVTFGYAADNLENQGAISYGVNFDDGRTWFELITPADFSYLYAAGSEITFCLKPVEGRGEIAMYLNGERHSLGKVAEGVYEEETIELYEYTFTMPSCTASVSFKIEDGQPQP